METLVGSPFGCFKKKGWSQGSPKLYGFESDTVSHFDKLITEQDHAASGRWLHQRPGGQLRERESELFEVYISATGTASYVTCRGRESEIERERLGVYGENCQLWGFQEINFAFWESGFAIWWDQVTAACLSKHVPPTQFIGCKLEIHQSFA